MMKRCRHWKRIFVAGLAAIACHTQRSDDARITDTSVGSSINSTRKTISIFKKGTKVANKRKYKLKRIYLCIRHKVRSSSTPIATIDFDPFVIHWTFPDALGLVELGLFGCCLLPAVPIGRVERGMESQHRIAERSGEEKRLTV
jgi:hypothetical protein